MHALQNRLDTFVRGHPEIKAYSIALSGGIDSITLLHAMATLPQELRGSLSLRALHINHGLHSDADKWSAHCRKVCEKLLVPYIDQVVDAQPRAGESPEAVAREARYMALESLLQSGECLLTAQHQNDQAETLLLQLLRGAGSAGLAAMPAITAFGQGYLARPWLSCSQSEIEAYAQDKHLSWVEDSSNQNPAFSRNFLRHHVMPRLAEHWPGYAGTLSRAARLQAETKQVLEEVGEADLQCVQQADGGVGIEVLQRLSLPRQRNVIRCWLRAQGYSIPREAQLEQIIQACDTRQDSALCISWQGVEIRRHRQALYALEPQTELEHVVLHWDITRPLRLPASSMTLSREALIQAGMNVGKIKSALEVRFRQGGETIQLPGRSHRHKLKKLLQEQGVPSWQRQRLPLLYHEQELIAVLALESPIIAAGWRS